MRILLVMLSSCLGGAIASFLSLAVSRVRRGRSIVRPASRCDACLRPLRPYENVPVVAYCLLGGKCRTCRASLPVWSFALELLGACVGGLIAYSLTA